MAYVGRRIGGMSAEARVTSRRLVVTSDLVLVAEAVAAALSDPPRVGRGFEVTVLPWGSAGFGGRPHPPDPVGADAGLALCDLEPITTVAELETSIGSTPVPWLVLSGAPYGPRWGALVDAGATAVLPADAHLDQVRRVLDAMVDGEPAMNADERRGLLHAWRAVVSEQRALLARMRSLSADEARILGLLYDGGSVPLISEELGVSERTVLSHTGRVLRKLQVRSHLAAVAAYATLRSDDIA